MRKAKKKIHPMPKLGWKDMLLYWSAMLFCAVGAVIAFCLPLVLREQIIFADPSVVATNSGAAVTNCFWIILWFITVICFILVPYRKRYPVFGRDDIQYGPPAYPRVFPLLMKNKPQYWVSPKKKQFYKDGLQIGALVMAIWLGISLWLYPNSIYQRADLRSNGTISVIDGSNQETMLYRFGDIESVDFRILHRRNKGSPNHIWYIAVVIHCKDGEFFRYRNTDYRGDWLEALEAMLMLRHLYGHLVSTEGKENLENVVRSNGLNDLEKSLLYQLFE